MMNKKPYSDPDLQVCRFEQSDTISDNTSRNDGEIDFE